jgi:hypothetical protein
MVDDAYGAAKIRLAHALMRLDAAWDAFHRNLEKDDSRAARDAFLMTWVEVDRLLAIVEATDRLRKDYV